MPAGVAARAAAPAESITIAADVVWGVPINVPPAVPIKGRHPLSPTAKFVVVANATIPFNPNVEKEAEPKVGNNKPGAAIGTTAGNLMFICDVTFLKYF